MKKSLLILSLIATVAVSQAQTASRYVLKDYRTKYHEYLVNRSILENLSMPLNEENESSWETAFWTITFINYYEPVVLSKIDTAWANINRRSIPFQRALLELLYTHYQGTYQPRVTLLLQQTSDVKIFTMCAEYLLTGRDVRQQKDSILPLLTVRLNRDPENPVLLQLRYRIATIGKPTMPPDISTLLDASYLPGNTLAISFQRSDRNYPGLVIVRDSTGHFIHDSTGNIFSVAQLARSASNMSGYLSNGNTPEGIYRLEGFDHSKSNILGPSTNIQLTMPGEYKASHFYKDSTLIDSIWDLSTYQALLPSNFHDYFPVQQSYYAGRAGRTEIIAHGNTVDPSYYIGQPYYPISPTQGCLCTRELWDEHTGLPVISDQLKLVDAIAKAGGPHGYYIVINLDDGKAPVTPADIQPYLKKAGQE